jgi:type II secretory pathway component PulF
MLRAGATLPDTLAFAERLEAGTPAAPALAQWRARIASGQRSAPEDGRFSKVLPPLFIWFIDSAREDPAAGLEKAADFYRTRAGYRTELLMYGALPVSVLLLGQMIIWQAAPVFRTLVWFMNALGSVE